MSLVARKIDRLEGGSLSVGPIPRGCRLCAKGSKMVLFVTGECGSSCYYCPLSEEKKNQDLSFADEMPVNVSDDLLFEAKAIRAEGVGISGGDPLCQLDRTLEYTRLLKSEFGPTFHAHLYTSMTDVDDETLARLVEAGLDEIRFHPQTDDWTGIERALRTELTVGIEIPVLPGKEAELQSILARAERLGVSFVNLNELESSETNFEQLTSMGFRLKSIESASIEGSETTAKSVVDWAKDNLSKVTVHYCSAGFKDGIQLRRRLQRRLEETMRDFEEADEADPLVVLGVIRARHGDNVTASQLNHVYDTLLREIGVPENMMHLDTVRQRVEIASWILADIVDDFRQLIDFSSILEIGVAYEYPTWDRLQTLFEPL